MSEKGLAEHYKVLKQFLVISDDLSTRTKTNSTRAARAREKLLKLSSAQFRELSTDVYDELREELMSPEVSLIIYYQNQHFIRKEIKQDKNCLHYLNRDSKT